VFQCELFIIEIWYCEGGCFILEFCYFEGRCLILEIWYCGFRQECRLVMLNVCVFNVVPLYLKSGIVREGVLYFKSGTVRVGVLYLKFGIVRV
jgi:hypothetical protein